MVDKLVWPPVESDKARIQRETYELFMQHANAGIPGNRVYAWMVDAVIAARNSLPRGSV